MPVPSYASSPWLFPFLSHCTTVFLTKTFKVNDFHGFPYFVLWLDVRRKFFFNICRSVSMVAFRSVLIRFVVDSSFTADVHPLISLTEAGLVFRLKENVCDSVYTSTYKDKQITIDCSNISVSLFKYILYLAKINFFSEEETLF